MVIKIKGEFIKVGQFLKKINEVSTGGRTKEFLKYNTIQINGKTPEGRSSKIRPGDIVWVNDTLIKIEENKEEIKDN
ncbi:RNA-binding S4 domain-containing protein [Mycoplasma crocodyli]|uniref:Conserved domain protein n=1 Tax=Mycoplasma crocodyli (strain ATCC 51981 / MP145) TaxID=512564 RepID=D5E4J4_MYCCM|nr:RNA-binding S4 domain-containing protein [Mycoplasma crocodyli]ADE19525.1 conserved domain protein [Mycoplasma crocodyli MP145]